MTFECNPTQKLARNALVQTRMRCDPGLNLGFDRLADLYLDTEEGKRTAKRMLVSLMTRMTKANGLDAIV
jgi:hypothetical protein